MKIQTDRLFDKVEELEKDNLVLVKKIVSSNSYFENRKVSKKKGSRKKNKIKKKRKRQMTARN